MAYSGHLGTIAFTATSLANINEWSMDAIVEDVTTIVFGAAWEASANGRTDVSVSCSGFAQKTLDTVALVGGTAANLILGLQAASGPAFTISTAILESYTETASIDAMGAASYVYQGNDTLPPIYGATDGIVAAALSGAYHGKNSKAYFGATPTLFTDILSWTITINAQLHDVSPMHATENGIVRAVGVKSATASVTCLKSTGDRQIQEGSTAAALELHRTATQSDGSFEGSAICTSVNIGVNADGIETITYNFKFTGTLLFVTS